MTNAKMIGGPFDGKFCQAPACEHKPGEFIGKTIGDELYVYYTVGGVLAWHYCGQVKWTPEESERRRKAAN